MKAIKNTIADLIDTNKITASFVSTSESGILIREVCENFSLDLERRWLWEKAQFTDTLHYDNDNLLWETKLCDFLNDFSPSIFLIITDNDFFPWTVVKCKKDELLFILKELPFFEYFVTGINLDSILFDTHHNSLLYKKRFPTRISTDDIENM